MVKLKGLTNVDLTNRTEIIELELKLDTKDKRYRQELKWHPDCDDPYHPGCPECLEEKE